MTIDLEASLEKRSKKEGQERLPGARSYLIGCALAYRDDRKNRKALDEAVDYYRGCVKASERGENIQ